MSSKMLLLLLSDQVLCLYLISKPPKDGLFVMPSFIYYPLLLCFKLIILPVYIVIFADTVYGFCLSEREIIRT